MFATALRLSHDFHCRLDYRECCFYEARRLVHVFARIFCEGASSDPLSTIVYRSFFIAFYFSFISFSSVGYGDYYPKTPAGRAFFVVWSLVGAGSLTVLFSGKISTIIDAKIKSKPTLLL